MLHQIGHEDNRPAMKIEQQTGVDAKQFGHDGEQIGHDAEDVRLNLEQQTGERIEQTGDEDVAALLLELVEEGP